MLLVAMKMNEALRKQFHFIKDKQDLFVIKRCLSWQFELLS
jgi:hypothetical protein